MPSHLHFGGRERTLAAVVPNVLPECAVVQERPAVEWE